MVAPPSDPYPNNHQHRYQSDHNQKVFIDRKDASASREAYDGEISNSKQVPQHLSDDASSDSVKEVFSVEQSDPVLAKKMALVNEAIDSIGMTGFQWKMFFLNGFGYAVDSVSRAFDRPFSPIALRGH